MGQSSTQSQIAEKSPDIYTIHNSLLTLCYFISHVSCICVMHVLNACFNMCVYIFLQMCEHPEAQGGCWEPSSIFFTPYSWRQSFSINPEVTDVAGLLASVFCDFPLSSSQGWDYWWAALGTWTPVPSLAWRRCGSLNNNSPVTLYLLIFIIYYVYLPLWVYM